MFSCKLNKLNKPTQNEFLKFYLSLNKVVEENLFYHYKASGYPISPIVNNKLIYSRW